MDGPEPEAARPRARMRDVAREAGVSTMTVSRALGAPGKVAPDTRARVAEAVARLGYVPDQVAGALSSRGTRLVTALVSTLGGSVFADTVSGLTEGLHEAGHRLLVGTTDYSSEDEEGLIAATLGRRPDGIALTSHVHTPGARAMLRRSGVPVVELWELPEDPIDSAVGFSNFEAARAMTRFLHATGRRRIALVGGDGPRDRRRREGHRAAIAELGLGDPRDLPPDPSLGGVEAGAAGLARLRERWPEADAVFCLGDAVALGALAEARRRGLDVPGDIAVAGFGDFEYAGAAGLALTTLRVPGRAMGEEAARVILGRRSGAITGPVRVDLGFEPVRRATA